MTDREKIRVEIERLISRRDEKTFLGSEKISALKEVLSFIDSMQEEPVSEDLEEAANEWDKKAWFSPISMVMDGDRPIGTKQHITSHADSFKAGARWQKEKDDKILEGAKKIPSA